MVLRMVGAEMISRLMQAEDGWIDTAWLLFGPDDPDLIEAPGRDDEDGWLLAAE
jgi:hypothetical protein